MDDTGRNRPPSALRSRGPGLGWVLAALALGAAGWGAWYLWKERAAPKPEGPTQLTPVAPPPEALAGPALPPSLGEALLRDWAGKLSPAPELGRWLSHAGIVRRLVAAVALTAEGGNPRPLLSFVEAPGSYAVVTAEEGRLLPSPQNAARSTALVAVVQSIDPAVAAQAYGALRPHLESAFREVARPGQSFHETLLVALERLIAVEIPDDAPPVMQRGLVYVYVDPAVEGLEPAQKLLLRLGADPARIFQAALRGFRDRVRAPAAP